MLRQTSSRNHRSKGLKLKKGLQITLLVLVSVWLVYQVKHSYEKKVAYVETESNERKEDDSGRGEVIRLGRKDLPSKMEADSSTLDERIEDEENEEMEQEMKHEENDDDDDPIDEQDLEKDDDLVELGARSSEKEDKDGGVDGGAVFEEEEHKEWSTEDQEKSFHGDNVSSGVALDPPAAEREELTRQAREKSFHGDNVASAVGHNNKEVERKEEESHKAREKSFRGDDVSSAVDHDAQLTKPLPEEHLKSMDRIFEGAANLSNAIVFQGPGVNGSNAAGEQDGATMTNVPSDSAAGTPNTHWEDKIDSAAVKVSNNQPQLHNGSEKPVNSTAQLNNQTQLITNLNMTGSVSELASPPSGTKTEVRTGEHDSNSDISSSPANNKADKGAGAHKDEDASSKIMNKAMNEDEVLLE